MYLTTIKILLLLLGGMMLEGCEKPKKPKQKPFVSVAKIEQRDVPLYVDAIGQAYPVVTVHVRPQVAGKLLETYIQQGDFVEEGQLLYLVDPRPYEAVLDQSKAQLERDIAQMEIADKTVERYKKVVDEDFLAVLTFEGYQSNAKAAHAQVELDKAAVRAAQINVDFCTIIAPVTGKVSQFVVDVGNIVAVDDPTAIVSIVPFSPIDVLFSISQQQLEQIRARQGNHGKWHFQASLPEHPERIVEGTTYFINNEVNQDTGTILLKGRVYNDKIELWPGEFVKVKVLQQEEKNALLVPPGAVLTGKNGPYLYSVETGEKVSSHNIQVVSRTNEYIAFRSNQLKPNDTVVTDGQLNIAPGMQVEIKK